MNAQYICKKCGCFLNEHSDENSCKCGNIFFNVYGVITYKEDGTLLIVGE